MARSMRTESAMSCGMYSGNLAWNRIFGCDSCFFHTRPMWTASVLCIGISGDTWPHIAGGQVALGSGNGVCAAALDVRPSTHHATTQAPATADARVLLCMLIIAGSPLAEPPWRT